MSRSAIRGATYFVWSSSQHPSTKGRHEPGQPAAGTCRLLQVLLPSTCMIKLANARQANCGSVGIGACSTFVAHRGPLSHEGLGGCNSCVKYRVPGRMTTGECQHVVDIVMPVAKEPQDCYISPSLEQGGPILKCVCVSLMAKHRLHRPQRFACLRQKKGFADLHAHFPPLLSVCSRQGSFKSKTTTFMARATVSS